MKRTVVSSRVDACSTWTESQSPGLKPVTRDRPVRRGVKVDISNAYLSGRQCHADCRLFGMP
jgi:hypothetical protein